MAWFLTKTWIVRLDEASTSFQTPCSWALHVCAVLQYAEFLRLAITKDKYRDLMPSLGDLLSPDKYGLDPEVAFLLYRPVVARVPFPDPPASKDEEDGEIPDNGEAPMEVEQGESSVANDSL